MKEQHMTPEEREIMRQAFIYLDRHADPPSTDDPESQEWWTEMVSWIAPWVEAWNGHPLVAIMWEALLKYTEDKAKEKTRRKEAFEIVSQQ